MFSPSQWADPTFLTFVKEYFELNFKEKFKDVTVFIVFYIAPDGEEVKEDILVSFQVVNGSVTPYLQRGKKMEKIVNAIFFAGSPSTWRKVAETGSIEHIQGRVVIPDDNFKHAKAEIGKAFFAIGNRVADRMAQGHKTSLNVADSIRYEAPPASAAPPAQQTNQPKVMAKFTKPALELMEESQDFKINLGVTSISRQEFRKMFYENLLKMVNDNGPKKLKKFWEVVEKYPKKEDYIHIMNPMELPVQLMADANLRAELLALRGKSVDPKDEFVTIVDFLTKKMATA